MFNSLLTDLHKNLQAIQWYKQYYYTALNEIYIAFAGTTEWDNDAIPPVVDPATTELTELIGISKATCYFVKSTEASGADVAYQDGSYWETVIPNNPAIDDYDNIISENVKHLYIETNIIYGNFAVNTFRKLAITHNPLKTDGNLVTDNIYENGDVDFDFDASGTLASQGNLILNGNTSKIILTSGQNLNIGLILKF